MVCTGTDDEAARKLYGQLPTGGGTPPPPRTSADAAFVMDFESRFNDPAGQWSVQEGERYAKILAGTQLLHAMARNSQHFQRAGITPEVVEKGLK